VLRSMNVRGSYNGMVELGSREDEVDVYCFQEVAVGPGERFYGLDGYETLGGREGFVKKEKGLVVSMLVQDRWRGKYEVIERCHWRIGIRLEVEEGKKVDI